MAKNLLDGIDCPKDPEEAQRLFRIAYRKSEAVGNDRIDAEMEAIRCHWGRSEMFVVHK